jgi:chemotaxis signal transduction protein
VRVEGASVPVLDLGERLGEQPAACAPRALVIVAAHHDSVGLAVDAIEEITLVEHILPAPGASADPVAALAEIDDRLVPLLDPEGLAASPTAAAVAVAA